MADACKFDNGCGGPQFTQPVEHIRGRDRVVERPQEAQRFRPVPHRAVPALGVALALVEVRDQQVRDSVPVVVGDQRPLCVGFLWRQRVVRAEQARELPAEPPLAGQPCRERTERAVGNF